MQKTITNNGCGPLYVGGRMIPPGESLVFEEAELPPEHRAAPEPEPEAPPPDRLAEIAGLAVKVVIPILADLSDEDLARLKAIEEAGQKRKSLLAEIAAVTLDRAAKTLDAAQDPVTPPPAGPESPAE
jgi:hypothetical protein